jgi:hypothetical protein
VVEMSADTFFALSDGLLTWSDATYNGSVIASGERSDLSDLFAALAAGK